MNELNSLIQDLKWALKSDPSKSSLENSMAKRDYDFALEPENYYFLKDLYKRFAKGSDSLFSFGIMLSKNKVTMESLSTRKGA